jgi:hypothetical protein
VLNPSPLELTSDEQTWLERNAEPLALVLEATGRQGCAFQDPRTMNDFQWLRNGNSLVSLVLTSGRQLEQEGKLDEALDRYFASFTVISQLSDPTLVHDHLWWRMREFVFEAIVLWANQKGQTSEQIGHAIDRLQALDSKLLQTDETIEANYILAGRYVRGDAAAQRLLFDAGGKRNLPSMLWPRLMPWETYRGERWLNQLTQRNLATLTSMRQIMAKGGGVDYLLPTVTRWESSEYLSPPYMTFDRRPRMRLPEWLDSTTPNLNSLVSLGERQSLLLAEFEAQRRGTILVLALEAFRIDHGDLPATLDELAGKYVDRLPDDPYTGEEFDYFPQGLPQPSTALERAQLEYVQRTNIPLWPGWPCVWCFGPTLSKSSWRAYDLISTEDHSKRPDRWTTFRLRKDVPDMTPVPTFLAWGRGHWFPVPKSPE